MYKTKGADQDAQLNFFHRQNMVTRRSGSHHRQRSVSSHDGSIIANTRLNTITSSSDLHWIMAASGTVGRTEEATVYMKGLEFACAKLVDGSPAVLPLGLLWESRSVAVTRQLQRKQEATPCQIGCNCPRKASSNSRPPNQREVTLLGQKNLVLFFSFCHERKQANEQAQCLYSIS